MINSFKAEWRKLRQRPAVWVLGGIMLVALILFGYAFNWIQLSFPSAKFHPEGGLTIAQLKTALYPINFVKNSLEGVGIVGSILTLILGALVVGSEFGWGTVAALASLGIALGDHATITWPATIDILKALGATWLIFEFWSLFGMTLAFLFRQSAMAIGIGLAYVLAIEGILFRLLGGFDAAWVTTVEKFFLGQNAAALIRSFGQPFPNPGQVAPIVTAGVAVLVLVIYSLVFTSVTSLVVRTRDVN